MPTSPVARVGIVIGEDAAHRVEEARALSRRLNLPLVDRVDVDLAIHLVVAADRLELRKMGAEAPGAVFADFVGSNPGEYRRQIGDRQQPLARAVGVGTSGVRVVDATAGLGRDAFRLAYWGCRVTAVERSAVVGEVLLDGLARARAVPELEAVVDERLAVRIVDAREYLRGMGEGERPDVIYLDPMFGEEAEGSAEIKKELQVLRALIGKDGDAAELFDLARQVARRRVVVKRTRHLPPFGAEPDTVYRGKIARYDVYRM